MGKGRLGWENRIGRRVRLRDLHMLAVAVEWGSIAKGALHLGMSQPSVSEAIASLEDALGVRLLDRTTQGIVPTIYGQALLKRAEIVFEELRQGVRDIEFLANPATGEVRVGCPESLAAGFLPAVIDRLSRQYRNIAVHVVLAQTGEQGFRELRERSVDLLLGRLFQPLVSQDVAVESLCQDRLCVVAGAQSPWAQRAEIALGELMSEPWILFPKGSVSGAYIEAGFRAHGLDLPEQALTSFSMELRFHLLATGRFLTVLHESVMRFNAERWLLKALPVELRVQPVPIAIFTLKHRTLSPVVQPLIEEARAVAKWLPCGT